MRFLARMGIFEELGPGRFASTPLTGIYLSRSPIAEVVVNMFVRTSYLVT